MGYMTVKSQTTSHLSLQREPSFLSKAVFVGFFVGVLGIFLFGSESFFFKVLIGIAAACLSCLIVDNYEICDFDKDKSEVRITRLHWFQHFMNQFNLLPVQPYVTVNLKEIKDVRVEEQDGTEAGNKAFQVVLFLDNGISLGVTEVFTTDDVSVHENVAKVIRTFLGCLPPLRSEDEADDEEEGENLGSYNGSQVCQVSSSGSDEEDDFDFEQINPAELEEMEKESAVAATGSLDGAGDVGEGVNMGVDKGAPVS